MKKKIVLVGTGISGLSTLYFLLKQSASDISEISIYEKENKIGGVLNASQEKGFLLEHGAQGVLSSRTQFFNLLKELDLDNDCVHASPKSAERAFFYKNQIISISPKNLIQILKTRLITILGIIRIFSEIFIKKNTQQNETVSQFFTRRFGSAVAKNFVAPLMKGIWGGGASIILVRHAFSSLCEIEKKHGSLLKFVFSSQSKKQKPVKKELLSFDHGMHSLPKRLMSAIQNLSAKNNIILNTHFNHHDKMSTAFDALIYSGQPWKDEILPIEFSSEDLNILKNIPTHSLIVVGIGSLKTDVSKTLNGFGALAVENNKNGVLGVISVHSLFEAHCPENSFLYRIMMGGENCSENFIPEKMSDAEILIFAKKYLSDYGLLDVQKQYQFEKVIRYQNYIPLPTEYQEKVLNAVENIELKQPNVFLTGNYILGPAVENCITQAQKTAEKISKNIAVH